MDLDKLTTADKLVVGGGLAYLIFMFLPWYGLGGASYNGWDYFLGGFLPLLLIIAMAAQVVLTRFSPETTLPDPPLPWGQLHLIAGVAAAIIVLLRLLIGSSVEEVELDREYGLFLAFLAALAVAAGGWLKFQDEGGTARTSGDDTAL